MGKLHTCMNCTTDITRQENEFKSSQCLKIIEKVAFNRHLHFESDSVTR